MDAFLRLSMGDRRLACLQVEERKRLQAVSVEKDFWVCWTLRELFSLPKASGWMTFKGGTSLSKAWGLIDRFSEDIDIVVGKDLLGFAGDASPDRASSNKQRKRRLDELMAACRTWMQNALKPALAESITKRLGDSDKWSLVIDPDADDGQCLLFEYPGAFPLTAAGYCAADRQNRIRCSLRRLAVGSTFREALRGRNTPGYCRQLISRVDAHCGTHLLGKGHASARGNIPPTG